jgi:hypothetical protein
MTLSSLSFVVFLDPYQGIYGVFLLSSLKICGIFGIRHDNMPSLSLTLLLIGLYVELIGGDTRNTYLQTFIA